MLISGGVNYIVNIKIQNIMRRFLITDNTNVHARAQPGGGLRELKPPPPLSQVKVEKKDKF